MCKRTRKIFRSMHFTAGAVNRIVSCCQLTVTVERKTVQCAVLTEIRKRSNNLERRSRRISSLQTAVQKHAALIVCVQCLPVLINRIGIKNRIAHIGKYTARFCLHHDNCTAVSVQCIGRGLLECCIQRCIETVSRVLRIAEFILYLL